MSNLDWRKAKIGKRSSITDETDRMKRDRAAKWLAKVDAPKKQGKHRKPY